MSTDRHHALDQSIGRSHVMAFMGMMLSRGRGPFLASTPRVRNISLTQSSLAELFESSLVQLPQVIFNLRHLTMSKTPQVTRIHHAAYRCHDAQQTVEWYSRVLGMEYVAAFAEDKVPSTGEFDPYMHVFLDCGGGNILAFFELPNQPPMRRDPNTPLWVQHIAFEVADLPSLLAANEYIEAQGIDVLGPTYHGVFKSIYFSDPSGHRIELACNIGRLAEYAELRRLAPLMLDEWSRTKRAPRHAAWIHEEPKS
jgi:catechol 2,3-dioxygenase-like lactoylglutathione lyase family enzyme